MDELERFRQEWRQEVRARGKGETNEETEYYESINQLSARQRQDRRQSLKADARRTGGVGRTGIDPGQDSSSNSSGSLPQGHDNQHTPISSSFTPFVPSFSFDYAHPLPVGHQDIFINDGLSTNDRKALEAFELAVDREHAGSMADAVKYYREAFRKNEQVDKLYREKYYKWANPKKGAINAVKERKSEGAGQMQDSGTQGIHEAEAEDIKGPQKTEDENCEIRDMQKNDVNALANRMSSVQLVPESTQNTFDKPTEVDSEKLHAGSTKGPLINSSDEVQSPSPSDFHRDSFQFVPADELSPCLIAKLPDELVSAILLVVARNDFKSFIRCAFSCKKMARIALNDQMIWKKLCEDVFTRQIYSDKAVAELVKQELDVKETAVKPVKIQTVTELSSEAAGTTLDEDPDPIDQALNRLTSPCRIVVQELVLTHYVNWKKMFLERPRIRFNGMYISTCNYLRPGVGETWSSPIHMVTYYRYLRFFDDGSCLSLLTTDEPKIVCPMFRRKDENRADSTKNEGGSGTFMANIGRSHSSSEPGTHDSSSPSTSRHDIVFGTWIIDNLDGDILIATNGSVDRYIFYMNLNIRSSGRHLQNKLRWKNFWSVNRITADRGAFSLKHDKAFYFVRYTW